MLFLSVCLSLLRAEVITNAIRVRDTGAPRRSVLAISFIEIREPPKRRANEQNARLITERGGEERETRAARVK